jgi:hypothetical protein
MTVVHVKITRVQFDDGIESINQSSSVLTDGQTVVSDAHVN